jgi:hypothetical protein
VHDHFRAGAAIAARGLFTLVASAVSMVAFAVSAVAQVTPGMVITAKNASVVQALVSPGTYVAVTKGMEMHVVAHQRVDWAPPYQVATEKYSGQVSLSADHRDVLGYVAG